MVNTKKVSFTDGVKLSFLKSEHQTLISEMVDINMYKLDSRKVEALKIRHDNKSINGKVIEKIITGEDIEKKSKKTTPMQYKLKPKVLEIYFKISRKKKLRKQ